MPEITLENGTKVQISQESYDSLSEAASKTWIDALDGYFKGRVLRKNAIEVRTTSINNFPCSSILKAFIGKYQPNIFPLSQGRLEVYFIENHPAPSYEEVKQWISTH